MPHLSPMNWLMMLSLMSLMLLLFTSNQWWSQQPMMLKSNIKKIIKSQTWKW